MIKGCKLSLSLFILYAKCIMSHAVPDEMKLESRLLRELSVTSDIEITPHLWQKVNKNLSIKVKEESEHVRFKTQNSEN